MGARGFNSSRSPSGPFHTVPDARERVMIRVDLHKVAGPVSAVEFIEKWGERLDVLLNAGS